MTNVDSANQPESHLPEQRGNKHVLRVVGLLFSIALLIGAVVFVFSHRAELDEAFAAIRNPSWWKVGILLLAVLANISLTAVLFSILIKPFGKVGLVEMQALIATTALLNFLPLRPGLFGRVAYHKLINGIAIRDTVQVMLYAIMLTVFVGICIAVFIAIATWGDVNTLYLMLALMAVFCVGMVWEKARLTCVAVLIRMIDVLVWTARYLLVFSLLGQSISFNTALAIACISIFATMVPFVSNGLGLREWAIGLAAPLLVREFGEGGLEMDAPLAIAADLLNRVAEIIIIAITGSVGSFYINKRSRDVKVNPKSSPA